MNQGLPKSIREALARQAVGDVHPSPDALAAFVEHRLSGRESQRVTDHLAQCADCREVVFLASNAADEPAAEEQEWMRAAAVPRISPALQARSADARAAARAGAAYESPRRGWTLRWAWVPAVAVVVLISTVWVWRSEFRPAPQSPTIIASKGPQPAATSTPQAPTVAPEPESEQKLALQKPLAKSLRLQTESTGTSHTVTAKIEHNAVEAHPSVQMFAAAPPAASSSDTAIGGLVPKSAVVVAPRQNSFVESEAQNASAPVAKPQPVLETPTLGMYAVRAMRPRWRITSDGHLEHTTTPDTWTRALADQPTTFHVVSVVGGNVWAGGSGGALFHSADGGQSWSKVVLASPPSVETGTIVSIRFSDVSHGVVTTDGGARWSTSDGGVTWTKE